MRKSVLAGMAAVLGLSAAASAVLAQASTQEGSAVKPGTYKVDPYHTQVEFSVLHFGFTHYAGLFSEAAGSLQLDPAHPAASKLTVTIPVQSVMTTVPKLTDELKGDQWFDAAKFPTATFASTSITPTGKDAATIAGNLTLHGVTKPVVLAAHFIGGGVNPIDKAYTVGFEATGTIKRSEFGVSTYVPMVGDDVRLTIAGAFELGS